MSSMLEQAIIDAATLREAALKNAEQSLIEKFAPQIKEAVESMLENKTESKKMKYEGRSVTVIHEADEDGNVTVAENSGKAFVVNESDLSDLTEDDIIQEEEMAASSAPPEADSVAAPFAGNPTINTDQDVELSLDIERLEDEITIDLGKLQQELDDSEITSGDSTSIEDIAGELESDLSSLSAEPEEQPEPEADTADEDDVVLQELLDLLDEKQKIDEEIEVDMREDKDGTFDSNQSSLEYKRDKQEARDAHHHEEEEPDDEGEQEDLQETIDLLISQNEKLENVVYKLNDKLNETLLSNAKLIYQNRTLCDASLNERQKSKIVEAIAKAESPKEAKQLHETLTTTVGSDQKKRPQSLSESVNQRSNLSGIINRGQNLNESKNSDSSFVKKMQKLAGIK